MLRILSMYLLHNKCLPLRSLFIFHTPFIRLLVEEFFFLPLIYWNLLCVLEFNPKKPWFAYTICHSLFPLSICYCHHLLRIEKPNSQVDSHLWDYWKLKNQDLDFQIQLSTFFFSLFSLFSFFQNHSWFWLCFKCWIHQPMGKTICLSSSRKAV